MSLQPPADWPDTLKECDFELVREELKYFFELASREAAAQGAEAVYRIEFVRGWQNFSRNPCLETAVSMVEGAPDYWRMLSHYFEACSPGGRARFFDSLLKKKPREQS